jgi:hypothetical protein
LIGTGSGSDAIGDEVETEAHATVLGITDNGLMLLAKIWWLIRLSL